MTTTKYVMALTTNDVLGVTSGHFYKAAAAGLSEFNIYEELSNISDSHIGIALADEYNQQFVEVPKAAYDGYYLACANDEDELVELYRKHYRGETTQLKKTLFGMDGTKIYEGYTSGQRWNGWQMPSFTLEVAKQMATDMAEEKVMDIMYSANNDKFVVLFEDDDDTEVVSPTLHIIDGEVVKLYGIGSGSWCWDEYNEAEKQQAANKEVAVIADELYQTFRKLSMALEHNDDMLEAINGKINDYYPFADSLEDMIGKVMDWSIAIEMHADGESIETINENIR